MAEYSYSIGISEKIIYILYIARCDEYVEWRSNMYPGVDIATSCFCHLLIFLPQALSHPVCV